MRLPVLLALAALPAACQIPMEQRIEQLLSRMTLEEKVGQMSQSTSMTTPLSGDIKAQIRAGRWGSFLNAGSPADRAEAQRIALKESRLGIPLIFGRDVIHGYKTMFPIPLAQSCTWDAALIEEAARVAGREAATEGIHWTFAPMMDITRDPRWGRIAETLGEDPLLTGTLAAAMIHGFQTSVAACAKHYAGYGAAEAGRDYNSAWIPDVLLREVYLRPFRMAVEAGVDSFMTSFNTLNGVPATGNRYLLRDILRKEWKYDGMVVSDYTAVTEMIAHGYARDAAQAAVKSVDAGVDMEMVSTSFYDNRKLLDPKLVDEAVRNILRLKFRLGLFDKPPAAPQEVNPTPETLAVAERAAIESAVLLKNDGGVLPLQEKNVRVAVIGPLADAQVDQMGTWSMDGRASDVQTPLNALRRILGTNRVTYAAGLKNSRDLSHSGFDAAVAAARQSDVAVVFAGEEHILSGEARSRAFLNMPGAQDALVEEIAKAGKPVVLVVMAGRPLTFQAAAAKAQAILYCFHPGTMGGPAIAKLLLGEAVPSGKLTVTFPRTVGQIPIYYSHLNTGRPATQAELGVPMGNPVDPKGYTSKYVDVDFTPEYPFGYGLSYTTFAYENLKVVPGELITFSAEIVNRGAREADEVVQLYTRQLAASVARPVRELKGFQRIRLKPGERQTITFRVPRSQVAYNNEGGDFQAWIAPNSAGGPMQSFTLQ